MIFSPQDKPPVGTPLDWGNSLASGLVGLWPFNEGAGTSPTDLVHGRVLAPNTGAGTTALNSWNFGGLDMRASTQGYSYSLATNDALALTPPCTIWLWQPFSVTSLVGSAPLFGVARTSAQYWGVSFVNGSSTPFRYQLTWGNSGSLEALLSTDQAQGNKNSPRSVVGVVNASTQYIYVDGALDISGSSSLTAITYSSGQVFIGGANVGVTKLTGIVGGIMGFWNRALSAAEIAELHESPFGMFVATKRIYYSLPSGGGKVPFELLYSGLQLVNR